MKCSIVVLRQPSSVYLHFVNVFTFIEKIPPVPCVNLLLLLLPFTVNGNVFSICCTLNHFQQFRGCNAFPSLQGLYCETSAGSVCVIEGKVTLRKEQV